MLKAIRLSSFAIFGALMLLPQPFLRAAEAEAFRPNETSSGRDTFEQNVFYEATSYLHLDRAYRKLFRKANPAKDVNAFDEVPDNTFFTNRHSRENLSAGDLARGSQEDPGPEASGNFSITGGHFGGANNHIWVTDAKGGEYLLKFDHPDALEMATAAEVIANRFYHALGYNVAQEEIVILEAGQLVPAAGAKVYDGTGFSKELTQEKLDQSLLFVPQTEEGKYRLLAREKIAGQSFGAFKFQGRRRQDPDDLYDHENRRELRALRVFASWLNHMELRPGATEDVLQDENGKKILKHYLVDLEGALGADVNGAKPASFGHEYFIDGGETVKAISGLGLWEKPWHKRLREAGEPSDSTTIGYFDNRYFSPQKFKQQLPNYPFKDLTRADGFWAAKIIMAFTDKDIKAIVQTGQYSNAEDAELMAKILMERRDLIGKYWFSQACPLDSIDVKKGGLVFEDLAVTYGFEQASATSYQVEVRTREGKKSKSAAAFSVTTAKIPLQAGWGSQVTLWVRSSRGGSKPGPSVAVDLTDGKVTGITHQN